MLMAMVMVMIRVRSDDQCEIDDKHNGFPRRQMQMKETKDSPGDKEFPRRQCQTVAGFRTVKIRKQKMVMVIDEMIRMMMMMIMIMMVRVMIKLMRMVIVID